MAKFNVYPDQNEELSGRYYKMNKVDPWNIITAIHERMWQWATILNFFDTNWELIDTLSIEPPLNPSDRENLASHMAYEMYNQKETIRDALEECNKNNFSIGSTLKNRQTTISSLSKHWKTRD